MNLECGLVQNSNLNGNIRDYASVDELICLANLENINSVLIYEGFTQSKRLEKLNNIAILQMKILNNVSLNNSIDSCLSSKV